MLFVFLRSSQPKDHEGAARAHSGQGGELEPIMCTDKALDELGSFSDLVMESKSMEQDWQIVLIACIAGNKGAVPSSKDATQPLKRMVQTVEMGGDLSHFLAFDRNGDPIQFCD